MRLPVSVLLDTGAGGGNYVSGTFWESICKWGGIPNRNIDKRGAGVLKAANPETSKVPPMEILGSSTIPIIFPPEDRVRNVSVRVVKGFPYALVLGAAFFHKHKSTLAFDAQQGFRPSPEAPWIPFDNRIARDKSRTPTLGAQTKSTEEVLVLDGSEGTSEVTEARSSEENLTSNRTKEPLDVSEELWEVFCAVIPGEDVEEPDMSHPSPVDAFLPSIAAITDKAVSDTFRGKAVWEDDGTLQWTLCLRTPLELPGFVSTTVEGRTKGPLSQVRQLVLILPTENYDLEKGAVLGVARGIQWWEPGTPLLCKVVNRSPNECLIRAHQHIAQVVAVNVDDEERFRSLFLTPDPEHQDEDAPFEDFQEGREADDDTLIMSNLHDSNLGQPSIPEE